MNQTVHLNIFLSKARGPILILVFLTVLVLLCLNVRYYNPSQVVIRTNSVEGEARLYWDSGIGFNQRESIKFTPYQKIPFSNSPHKVEITRLGTFNHQSQGSEVWIDKIMLDGNKPLSLKEIADPKVAVMNENQKLALVSANSTVKFQRKFKIVDVTFNLHPWSGKVKISIDGKSRVVDLYAEQPTLDTYTFSKGASQGTVESKITLPQLNIRSIKIVFSNPEAKIYSFESVSKQKTLMLQPRKLENSTGYILQNPNLKMASFRLVLFAVQLFIALLFAWLANEFIKFLIRLNPPDINFFLNYIFRQDKRHLFWVMFLTSASAFSLWLLGQWPGMMTVDSYYFTWHEIRTLNFLNVTPWIYNLYVLALTQFHDSPAMVALFQIFSVALLGSTIFYYALKHGANGWVVLLGFLLFISSIPVGIYNITIWKDIPFTLLMVFWGFFIFHLYFKKKYFQTTYSFDLSIIIPLSISLVLLATMRHNGRIFLLAVPLILLIFKLFNKKNFYQLLSVSILLFAIVVIITPRISSDNGNVSEFFARSYKIPPIAAIYSSKSYYTPSPSKDAKLFNKWLPNKDIKSLYTPVSQVDTVLPFTEGLKNLSPDDLSYIDHLYYMRGLQNFNLFFADRAAMFLGAMGLSPNNVFIITNELENSGYKDEWRPIEAYRFTPSPKIKTLHVLLKNYVIRGAISHKGEIPLNLIFFNTFPAMLLFIAILMLYKWYPANALYAFFFLYNLPFLFIVLSTCEWRYMYFLLLASFFVLPLLSMEGRISRKTVH